MVPVVCPLWLLETGAQCVLDTGAVASYPAEVVMIVVGFPLGLLQMLPWRVVFLQLRDL